MVMGDTVVFQDEVDAAMDAAFAHGLEVTGLHNHFFYDEPKVYFMHVGGMGEAEKLAKGVKAVWDAIKTVRKNAPEPATRFAGGVPKAGKIDAAPVEKALGHKGEAQGGVFKVTIGREGKMHGVKIAGSMGLTTWAAFSGSDELAAVDGDFIMTAGEVQPVLRALRKGGLHIVALHNHMIGEEPAFYFTHFWGKSRSGKWIVKRKTARDRFRRTVARISRWCRQHRHDPLRVQHTALARKLTGHYGYFGVNGNFASLARLLQVIKRVWCKWLRRRSQRTRLNWDRFATLLERFPLPPARIPKHLAISKTVA